ncbi:hypothetical protein [Novosphingobium resinovorum]|uniref:extracellular catalytic domain type 2 short-chain-length polyhydroxyalkanoate depolymerase n=1 Tax=Novosphingobium resinovorum TaxID=158500 RepID=UPI002ED14840|nr:hypothetical protein [Novosphingobium resinovorum]
MRRVIAAFLCLLALFPPPALADPPPLPHLGTQMERTSVSGLSSGAFMAVQYAVAFSQSTIGAGIVAGGPYGCAAYGAPYAGGWTATQRAFACMKGQGVTDLPMAARYRDLGLIDPLDNIARQRIYLFHGTADGVVATAAMDAVAAFYRDHKVSRTSLLYVKSVRAGHAFLSDDLGDGCLAKTTSPYISKCRKDGTLYDQPQAILRHIFGSLNAKAAALSSAPEPFDQRPFRTGQSSLDDTGYLYVPAPCRDAQAHCPVHVVFHGCQQGARGNPKVAGSVGVGDAVYGRLGFNEWADTNRIVMLYPQVIASVAAPVNPMGCWDWWGYDGQMKNFFATFPTREGTQVAAIHKMLEQLALSM